MDLICEDLITPVVSHLCDEVWNEGQLEQNYNYLTYQFEVDGGRLVRARAYLDEIDTVSIFGPYVNETDVGGEITDAVLAYLKRRYQRIQRFSLSKGYEMIWEWGDN